MSSVKSRKSQREAEKPKAPATPIASNDKPTAALLKCPFSIADLVIGTVFGSYFLTVSLIEVSLALFTSASPAASSPNPLAVYLSFKREAPVWFYWQILTLFMLPLSLYAIGRDLCHLITRKASAKRNFIDIVNALQLFAVLYLNMVILEPFHEEFLSSPSLSLVSELLPLYWANFALNFAGWLFPFIRYSEWMNEHAKLENSLANKID